MTEGALGKTTPTGNNLHFIHKYDHPELAPTQVLDFGVKQPLFMSTWVPFGQAFPRPEETAIRLSGIENGG